MAPKIEYVSRTNQGLVRQRNEDAWLELALEDGRHVFAVCDGMGGHCGGDIASQLAADSIGESCRTTAQEPELHLRSAFEAANQSILQRAASNSELQGMGTTVVAMQVGIDGSCTVAHVGDSRAYRLRRRPRRLEQITHDHSLVARLVREGTLSVGDAEVHPYRNMVERALGLDRPLEIEIQSVVLDPGDRVLLCSDGLTSEVPDDEIAQILDLENIDEAATGLVDAALANGGRDNVTVQVIDLGHGRRRPTGWWRRFFRTSDLRRA
jgi:protein phosphatase